MQPPPNTLTPTLLCDQFAEHIAHHASFLGLDDHEEKMLWRYFCLRGKHTSRKVIDCLRKHAELTAFEIKKLQARAVMPAGWVKPQGMFRQVRPLEVMLDLMDDVDLAGCGVVFTPVTEINEKAIYTAQLSAFDLWYDKLTSSLVDSAVKEPDSDLIEVELISDIIDLKKLLAEM